MNPNDMYVVHKAVLYNHLDKLKVLVEEDKNRLSCRNQFDQTPLLASIFESRSDDLILYLIEAGSDVHAVNSWKKNSLHIMAIKNLFKREIAVELIKRGIDVNARDFFGRTPMHTAVSHGVDLLTILLHYNADVTIKSAEGDTALGIALNCGSYDAFEMLVDYYSHEDLSVIINNYFCVSNNWSKLQSILQLESSKIFKEIWSVIDREHLVQALPTLLMCYFDNCNFPKHEWVEALVLILESNVASSLMCTIIQSLEGDNFLKLFVSLYERNIDLEDRVILINRFLSLGAKVSHEDVTEMLNIFGCGKDFECLIYGAGCTKLDVVYHPLYYYLVSLQNDYSFDRLQQLFEKQIWSRKSIHRSVLQQRVITNLGYFSLSSCVKNYLLNMCDRAYFDRDKVKERLSTVPEFPTLLELSRNQVLRHIVEYFKVKYPYGVFDVVNRLEIPQVIKDIILFRSSIY